MLKPLEPDAALTVAGVTVFKPDVRLLGALLDQLLAEGVFAFVYIDGPTDTAIDGRTAEALRARPGMTVPSGRPQPGIGHGLNSLALAARASGAGQIVFFDQDSSLPGGLLTALFAAMEGLRALGSRVAIVGPRPVNPADQDLKPPRYRRRGPAVPSLCAVPVDFVITSGSLMRLEAFDAVGPFMSGYRMDAIDTEWCFRAWSRGWSIYLAETLDMPHRIGDGVIAFGPLRFPRQSEARMATYFRNQAHAFRLGHVPLLWKARLAVYLPLQAIAYVAANEEKPRLAARFAKAIVDGLRGRLDTSNGP